MKPGDDAGTEIARLRRRVEREVAARQLAESIAERGLRDLYQRQQEIALLESIAAAANEASGLEQAMLHALAAICDYMQWPLGHVLFPDEHDADQLESSGIWHDAGGGQFDALRTLSDSTPFTRSTGLPGKVLQLGGPAWANADEEDAVHSPRMPALVSAGLASLFAFPVKIGSEIVAILEFFSRERQSPDPALPRLMVQIGTHLGRVVERRRAKEHLLHDALHDPLTQLGNRKLFLDRLQHYMNRTQRVADYQFAVLFIDLDRFKAVNDGLGHHAGDQLIVATAQRLTACLRQNDLVAREVDADMVARLGGDEFTILLDNIVDAKGPIRVAERLLLALAEPHVIDKQTIFVTASIGISISSTGYMDVAHMLRDADIAMYHAKQQGRARWVMFDQAMQERAVRRLKLEAELRQAMSRGEIHLQYQPIVTPSDGMVRGFEALMRWKHPVYGMVSPSEFIPVAEDIGIIGELGRWSLKQACDQLCRWQDDTDTALSMSVNLSAVQLSDDGLVDLVGRTLKESGIRHGTLKLELTESAVMTNPEQALDVFERLHALGVKLSLDDFGTGYSSLSHLRRLPIDTLKIDRSFVSEMDADDEKRQIVEVVIMLARTLGLEVVAEGAETSAEVGALLAMGSDFVQGYYYYHPMNVSEIAVILSRQNMITAITPD
jgi:diguanylate cyclase (GGDEF)-like protein